MKNLKKNFTWWTICGPNDGIKGESMNPMTFGNMTHPIRDGTVHHLYYAI